MTRRLAPGVDDFDGLASPGSLAWAIGGVAAGTALALAVLPDVAPAVVASVSAPQPRSWWYLSRASGLVSYALVAVSMLLGLLLSTRFAKTWPGNAVAFALHEHASILGLAFALLHALVLLGDHDTPFTLLEVLLPFGAAYRPSALGMGQLAFYGMALLAGTFYVRRLLGQRAWRLIHFASFVVFALALLHGLASATDRLEMLLGVVPAVLVVILAIYRGLARSLGEVPRDVHSLRPLANPTRR